MQDSFNNKIVPGDIFVYIGDGEMYIGVLDTDHGQWFTAYTVRLSGNSEEPIIRKGAPLDNDCLIIKIPARLFEHFTKLSYHTRQAVLSLSKSIKQQDDNQK